MQPTRGANAPRSPANSHENFAEFLSRKDSGSIVVGRRADMVLLEADPSQEITKTQKISAVVVAAQFLARKDLDPLLEKASAAAATWQQKSPQKPQQ